MNKKLNIEISCNNTITNINKMIEESDILEEKKINSKIITATIREIFKADTNFRNNATGRIIWYNFPVNIKISFDNILILDTNIKEYKIFQRLLKFNDSASSKREYAKIIYYLSVLSESNLIFNESDILFSESVNKILKKLTLENLENLEQSFSDYQMAILCQGMKNSEARSIAKSYFKFGKWEEENKNKARLLIKSAIKKYGIDFVDYCLKLPSKPFKISNTKQLFSQFERVQLEEPEITLQLGKTLIKLASKDKKIKILERNNNHIGSINKEGKIKISEKIKNYNVILALLIQYSENPLKQILYYGAKTGMCSFCGIELTHPTSLILGYGEQCARNYKLPWR